MNMGIYAYGLDGTHGHGVQMGMDIWLHWCMGVGLTETLIHMHVGCNMSG